MTEPVELCPDCGRPPWDGEDNTSNVCIRISGYWDVTCADDCQEVTITRLRSELASLRALSEAERAVVEAAVAWNNCDRRIEIESAELSLAGAVDELLSLRKDPNANS